MANQQPARIQATFWIKLIFIPLAMFGFAFAMVPLYDVFCDVTGLNGRTRNAGYEGLLNKEINEGHKINISFSSAISPGFPIKFYPKVKDMDIVPGKVYTMYYIAENRSDETIIGQAVPSVAPSQASVHFKKLQCFCFTNQTFEPRKPIEMPVRFFVDTKLSKHVQNITLSYNFFKVKDTDKKVAGL